MRPRWLLVTLRRAARIGRAVWTVLAGAALAGAVLVSAAEGPGASESGEPAKPPARTSR